MAHRIEVQQIQCDLKIMADIGWVGQRNAVEKENLSAKGYKYGEGNVEDSVNGYWIVRNRLERAGLGL